MAKVVRRSDMILKLLKNKGILSGEEYRLALAAEPNISGLQKKVDETIQKEEVFANISSAIDAVPEVSGNVDGEVQPVEEMPAQSPPGEGAHPENPGTSPEDSQTELK
jgi:monofunctional biosynthetic peptidoglycan transglycosylase